MRRPASILSVAVLAAAMLSGCCPCRRLTTGTRDSVRIETVVRTERIIDTAFIEVPVEVVRQTVRDTISHLETSFAASDARIDPDGSLFHYLANKPQKRPVSVETKVVYRDSVVYRDRETENVIEVPRPLTWWQQTQIRGFWAALALLALAFRKSLAAMLRRLIG